MNVEPPRERSVGEDGEYGPTALSADETWKSCTGVGARGAVLFPNAYRSSPVTPLVSFCGCGFEGESVECAEGFGCCGFVAAGERTE